MILLKYKSDPIPFLFKTFQYLLQDKIQSPFLQGCVSVDGLYLFCWYSVPATWYSVPATWSLHFLAHTGSFPPQDLSTCCCLQGEYSFHESYVTFLPPSIQRSPSSWGHLWLLFLKLNPNALHSFFFHFIFLPSTYHYLIYYVLYLFIWFTICLFPLDCKPHECRIFSSVCSLICSQL